MGTGSSKHLDTTSHGSGEDRDDHGGGQLYVSLKMENYKLKGDLVPYVYGSVPLGGSWDTSKALPMERESTSMWELSFVVPPNHETLEFKFLLKPKYNNVPCIEEEGKNRQFMGGTLQGVARLAVFKLSPDEILEYRVFIKVSIKAESKCIFYPTSVADCLNPFLELTLKARKKISSVIKHIHTKWGCSVIAIGEPMLVAYDAHLRYPTMSRRWTLKDTFITAGDVYTAVESPAIFRLSYGWFSDHEPQRVSAVTPLHSCIKYESINKPIETTEERKRLEASAQVALTAHMVNIFNTFPLIILFLGLLG